MTDFKQTVFGLFFTQRGGVGSFSEMGSDDEVLMQDDGQRIHRDPGALPLPSLCQKGTVENFNQVPSTKSSSTPTTLYSSRSGPNFIKPVSTNICLARNFRP